MTDSAEYEAPEPTLIDLVRELRQACFLFDGAMACTPQEAWEEAIAKVEEMRRALREARDCIESWGAYADPYIQEKHDLAGDLAAIDTLLGPEYACPKCGKLASSLWGDCDHSDGSQRGDDE